MPHLLQLPVRGDFRQEAISQVFIADLVGPVVQQAMGLGQNRPGLFLFLQCRQNPVTGKVNNPGIPEFLGITG